MRRDKVFRGRSNRGSGGHRNNSGRGGGSGRYNNRRSSRAPRHASFDSGNQRERIAVESGHLVMIDQFMFANPQFLEKLSKIVDEDPTMKDDLVKDYGGVVVQVEPGTYRIERDPYAPSIVVHPEGYKPNVKDLPDKGSNNQGHVYIDTRCLAMVDRELLDDTILLEKYQQLWFSGQDKACRDLLRDNGGAVRYGFGRLGDELGVYLSEDDGIVCLWPDVSEEVPAEVG